MKISSNRQPVPATRADSTSPNGREELQNKVDSTAKLIFKKVVAPFFVGLGMGLTLGLALSNLGRPDGNQSNGSSGNCCDCPCKINYVDTLF